MAGGLTVLAAAPSSAAPAASNHGQCVSQSPKPDGKGGRSAVAKDKDACQELATRLVCTENEAGADTVQLDSAADTVTIAGSGPGSAGSSLSCATNIVVAAGDTISASYTFAPGTDPCGGGVPRLYAVIDGQYVNTFDDNPNTCESTVTSLTLTSGGTVTEVGFVYDRGDTGSVTYSGAQVGGQVLNI
jgi:hypothetical protein